MKSTITTEPLYDGHAETLDRSGRPVDDRFFWYVTGAILVLTIGLVAAKSHTYAALTISSAVLILSFVRPTFGVVLVVAFFTCDQLMDGLSIGNLAPGRYLILISIIGCLPYFFRYKPFPYARIHYVLYHILFFLGIVTLIWAPDTEKGVIYLLKLAVLVVWARLSLPLLADRHVLEQLSALLAVGTGLVAAILVFGNVSITEHSYQRLVLEGLGINALGISFGFVIVFSVVFLTSNASVISRIVVLLSCLLIYFAVLKMGTRSVALGIPVAFILGAFSTKFRYYGKAIFISLVAIFFLSLIFYVSIANGLITGKLADRFLELTELQSYTENSRITLAKKSLAYAAANPIGTGVGNEHLVFEDLYYSIDLFSSHNTLISTLVQFGIIGVLLQVAALAILIIGAFRVPDPKHRFLLVSLIAYFILQLMKGSFLETRLFWIPTALIIALLTVYLGYKPLLNRSRGHTTAGLRTGE